VKDDDAIRSARGLARLKAKSIVGQGGLTADDQDDVAAQLLLAVCSQLRNYDSDRASLRTFMCRVMDREIATILRYRLAWRRLPLGRPELIDGDSVPDLAQGIVPSTADRLEFWLDVGNVVRALPAPVRTTVMALRCGSPTEASETLGTARSVVYEHIAHIRKAFLAAGIGPNYFVAGGAQ
jgi:DNA-directed RNA polymerase specialized sigma24 family protein